LVPLLQDFIFPSESSNNNDEQLYLVDKDLSPGMYYLGLFNMDYYVHSDSEYVLKVTLTGE
jgi:hypothetical protein